jgi:hypothetical protein
MSSSSFEKPSLGTTNTRRGTSSMIIIGNPIAAMVCSSVVVSELLNPPLRPRLFPDPKLRLHSAT